MATTHIPGSSPTTSDHSLQLTGISKTLGGRRVVIDLDLKVGSGELACLLGASGCGKTTTLRMIGGFLIPDEGKVVIDGIDYTTTPPEKRPTAMVFQNYALWPHMTVFDNVAFGLKLRRLPKTEISNRVEEVLTTVGLMHHIRSHPGQISGGEQQRVALARALVLQPSVLLLDEPLSNLDAKLRVRVREEIRELQRRTGITMVFVTHDQEEALSIADRIAVMNHGQVEQYAGPDEVYRNPETQFVARFVGTMNFLNASLHDGVLSMDGAPAIDVGTSGPHGTGLFGVRPEDVTIVSEGEGAAPAEVIRDTPLGHYREVVMRLGGEEIRAYTPPSQRWFGRVGVRIERLILLPDDVAS
ncbi:MAG: ABC transporter ATP-binding protein [Arachnia sp.]